MGPDGHGPGVELTAAGLDPSGYRLATGAEDGSVKVWDVGSGQVLKERKAPGRGNAGRDEEHCGIIGVGFCDKSCLVVVGRSKPIVLLSVVT